MKITGRHSVGYFSYYVLLVAVGCSDMLRIDLYLYQVFSLGMIWRRWRSVALMTSRSLDKASMINQQIHILFLEHEINLPHTAHSRVPAASSHIPLMQSHPSNVKRSSLSALAPAAVLYGRWWFETDIVNAEDCLDSVGSS